MAVRPLVSVGVPVYNGERFLADSLRSLQEQTFEDFEVLISDNASSDGTEEIARSYVCADARFRYVRSDLNRGANPNFNRTVDLAEGTFFRWQAHDDLCDPRYLSHCVEVLRRRPAVRVVHCKTTLVDRLGDPLVRVESGLVDCDGVIERFPEDARVAQLLADELPHVRFDAVVNRMPVFFDIFGLMRREDIQRAGLLRNFYGADKVFLAERALEGPIVRLDDTLFFRRCHPQTSTRAKGIHRRAMWSDVSRAVDLYPALMLRGYLSAVGRSGLDTTEKLRCVGIVAKRLASPWERMSRVREHAVVEGLRRLAADDAGGADGGAIPGGSVRGRWRERQGA